MPIVLQFYPNGEFTQGVDTSSNRPPKHVCKQPQISITNAEITQHDLQLCQQQTAEMGAQIYGKEGTYFADTRGETFCLVESQPNYCVLAKCSNNTDEWQERVDTSIYRLVHLGLLSPLVHQSVESSENQPSRKKLQGMTKNMGRNIRNGVYLLEQLPGGKDCLSFLTLTLPSLSQQGLAKCCEKWDYMVSRFLDWLGTRLKKCNIKFEYVYCTEIQSKRLQQRNEYAPHLHIVFRGRNGKKCAWAVTPKQARKAWKACLASVVDEHFKCDALENLQRIKYSAARYLSKYMSKGGTRLPAEESNVSSGESESHIKHLHTQWGGMARSLARRIRTCTTRIAGAGKFGNLAMEFLSNLELLAGEGLIKYFRRGYIPLGVSRATGMEYGLHVCGGCLSTPTYAGGFVHVFQRLSQLHPIPNC